MISEMHSSLELLRMAWGQQETKVSVFLVHSLFLKKQHTQCTMPDLSADETEEFWKALDYVWGVTNRRDRNSLKQSLKALFLTVFKKEHICIQVKKSEEIIIDQVCDDLWSEGSYLERSLYKDLFNMS